MNSDRKYLFFIEHKSNFNLIFLILLTFFLFSVLFIGCSDKVKLPTSAQLLEFKNAGPLQPAIDVDLLVKAKIGGGPYRVMPSDVLELTMPAILQAVTKEEYKEGEKYAPYMCRISNSGTITLPLVGELRISGMTLAQIETAVIDLYYPEYAVVRPSVFAKVVEYNTSKVSINGAVNRPGIYSLRRDQMTLVNLIMQANGIVNEGAAVIRINHSNQAVQNNQRITEGQYRPRTIQTKQQLASSFGNTLFGKPANNSNLIKIDVQMSFIQDSKFKTTGRLVIKDGDKILLNEQLDISDEQERLFMIKTLLFKEPRVSTNDIEKKLSELANLLKSRSPGSVSSNRYELKDSKNSTVFASNKLSNGPGLFTPKNGWEINNSDTINQTRTSNSGFYSSYPELTSDEAGEIEQDAAQFSDPQTIVLPVKGLNIPFSDVVLHDGDSVIVERLQLPLFSVIGLVNKPGNFQYPTGVQYSLMQALAFAGGLDRAAEPRYATIYRLKPDGTISHVILQVAHTKDRAQLDYALQTHIKPGDIIAVEHTPRTRTKLFLESIFRINIGTYLRLEDAWD